MRSEDSLMGGDPVEGTGGEMLPNRGLPFDIEGNLVPSDTPVDLTPEELEELLTSNLGAEREGASEVENTPDGGMGAAFPMLEDEDLGEETAADDDAPVLLPHELAGALDADMAASGAEVSLVAVPALTPHPFSGEPSEDMLRLFLTDDRLNDLWLRMDAAQQAVRISVPSLSIARRLQGEIESARNLLLTNRDNYEEAERLIAGVELEITVVQRSIQESGVATRLFLYELMWSVVFMIVLFLSGIGLNLPFLNENTIYALNSAAWGGLGGIVGAIYALWRHVTIDMDFSKTYKLWYITNPIMGIFLGVVMYLIMLAGLFSLTLGANTQEITSPYIIYVVAFVVGYQQNVAWDLIRRIIKVVFQLNEGEKNAP